MTLRSRNGTSSARASVSTISRLGTARPVSTKLRCRGEISAAIARSSWLMRRSPRHSRSSDPTTLVFPFMAASTDAHDTSGGWRFHYPPLSPAVSACSHSATCSRLSSPSPPRRSGRWAPSSCRSRRGSGSSRGARSCAGERRRWRASWTARMRSPASTAGGSGPLGGDAFARTVAVIEFQGACLAAPAALLVGERAASAVTLEDLAFDGVRDVARRRFLRVFGRSRSRLPTRGEALLLDLFDQHVERLLDDRRQVSVG